MGKYRFAHMTGRIMLPPGQMYPRHDSRKRFGPKTVLDNDRKHLSKDAITAIIWTDRNYTGSCYTIDTGSRQNGVSAALSVGWNAVNKKHRFSPEQQITI